VYPSWGWFPWVASVLLVRSAQSEQGKHDIKRRREVYQE
jgi:hypothetical protein